MASARRVICVVDAGAAGGGLEGDEPGWAAAQLEVLQEMLAMGYMAPNARIILCHRPGGAHAAAAGLLGQLLQARGLGPVELRGVEGDFTVGLAEVISGELREGGGGQECALELSGASALEAAVGGVLGQLLGVRVYSRGERGVVCLPPLPVRVDEGQWLRNYRLWRALELSEEVVVRRVPGGVEGLVEVRSGREGFHLRLSPAGRVLSRAMRPVMERALSRRMQGRATPAPPLLGPWDYGELREGVRRLLGGLAEELGFVGRCEVVGWARGRVEVPGGWVEGGELMGAVELGGHQVIFRVEPVPSDGIAAAVHLTEWVVGLGGGGTGGGRGE